MTTLIHPPKAPSAWWRWRTARPFWGGLLVTLGGAEILLAVKAPLPVVLHVGMQGLVGFLVPLILVLCGVLLLFNPAQRLFYSTVAAVLSLASWATSNLGGFLLGMLLGLVGSALAFAWTPNKVRKPSGSAAAAATPDPAHRPEHAAGDEPDHADEADEADGETRHLDELGMVGGLRAEPMTGNAAGAHSAEPDSVKPDSAKPDSAEPHSPGPHHAAGPRHVPEPRHAAGPVGEAGRDGDGGAATAEPETAADGRPGTPDDAFSGQPTVDWGQIDRNPSQRG